MPLSGPPPKPNARRRNSPTHDWQEVPNTPFPGPIPVTLPTYRTVIVDGEVRRVKVTTLTRAWWRTISAMPHCRLWADSDWLFAVETALIADDFFRGNAKAASELRQRERVLGTTADARTALRIRYVDQVVDHDAQEPTTTAAVPSSVTRLSDRRRRLTDAS